MNPIYTSVNSNFIKLKIPVRCAICFLQEPQLIQWVCQGLASVAQSCSLSLDTQEDYIFHSPLHLGWGCVSGFRPMGCRMALVALRNCPHPLPLPGLHCKLYVQGCSISNWERSLDLWVPAWRRIAQLASTMMWVRNKLVIVLCTEILRVVYYYN